MARRATIGALPPLRINEVREALYLHAIPSADVLASQIHMLRARRLFGAAERMHQIALAKHEYEWRNRHG